MPATDAWRHTLEFQFIMQTIKCLFVGALKADYFKSACDHYLTSLRRYVNVDERIIKDVSPRRTGKSEAKRIALEGEAILSKIDERDLPVCLDVAGKVVSSPKLASLLQGWLENETRVPCFIIGGPFGMDASILQKSAYRLSLGPMTFPHELARVILLEQLYRACTIMRNIPYHH
ncbi:23S rRNA (pseudouridine(1915)-N(3))-methyltransferase RlmH [Desulfovibrio inopinatus]|uniref:23S rRNA (pseudouridine(1915)-N(3))-methyltransferase RlmH n=1 Tax=Desulfovibrio inopinatus TaxID=102109 RepID=UPI0004068406|nr:23S rRNA (pseudouridine(1915)-N(3))-methyltransferase RlmH [Desulfovibrio inopinatus]